MAPERLRLFLVPSPTDPSARSSDYQKALRQVGQALQAQGVEVSSYVELREGVGAETTYLGEFGIELVADIGPALGAVIGAWLRGRYGRKVRLKVAEIEAEAQTVAEVEMLLARAQEVQKLNRAKATRSRKSTTIRNTAGAA